ncbi:MAG TPA: YciI family protein [Myxococcota bacterium]|nr:YciI family protein [Myxococcota bacterium]
MLYAILCYGDQDKVRGISAAQEEALMQKLGKVHARLIDDKKLGPHFRLMTTGAAKTLRAEDGSVYDGPFAETKEALLGLYVVECESLDDALRIAHDLEVPRIEAGVGGQLEVRPLLAYFEGTAL